MVVPLPANEDARLSVLHHYNILDTLPSSAFDDITELAAQICQTPIALISFVDRDRQWFKSKIGMDVTATPREVSFCAHAILTPDDLFVVEDTLADERFAENPLVTSSPGVRFYAGAPIVTADGYALGTLCVMDQIPRHLNTEQLAALRTLSRLVLNQLDQKQAQEALQKSERHYRALFDSIDEGFCIIEMIFDENEEPVDYRFLEINPAFERQTGLVNAQGKRVRQLLPQLEARWPKIYGDVATTGQSIRFTNHVEQLQRWYDVYAFRFGEPGAGQVAVLFNDITERKRAEDALHRRLAELETLYTLSSTLRTAQTQTEALPILLEETLAALETDTGIIWLHHPEQNELRAAAAAGWLHQMDEILAMPSQGITGFVLASGETHLSPDFQADPLAVGAICGQFPSGWGGICLPLRSGTIIVGVLLVAACTARPFTPEQIKLLESLADMGGTALHRISLHDETLTRLDQLQTLHAIDVAITSTLDLKQALNVSLDLTTTQLGLDAASVLLYDPSAQKLVFGAERGFRTALNEHTMVPIGQGITGQAVLQQGTVWADDLSQLQESQRLIALWKTEGFAAYHGIPLFAKGRFVGLLEVFSRTPRTSDTEWRAFLETLAGQIAIAIDNAALYAEIQSQAQLTKQIIDSAPEGMVVLDQEQRLVMTNPTALAHLPFLANLVTGDVVTELGNQPLAPFLLAPVDSGAKHELTLAHPLRMLEVAAQPLAIGLHAGGWLLVLARCDRRTDAPTLSADSRAAGDRGPTGRWHRP